MKKKIICILLLMVCIAAGYILYNEIAYGVTTMIPVKMTEKEVLQEIPELVLTEQDSIMYKKLLATTEIEEAIVLSAESENGMYVVPLNSAKKLLFGYIPEGYELSALEVSKTFVYITFLKEGEQSIIYGCNLDSGNLQKTIGIYGKNHYGEIINKSAYVNNNGECTKYKEKHLWLKWIKDE